MRKHPSIFRVDLKQRLAAGKKLREKVPRSSHGKWTAPANRPDPIELLKQSDHGRLPVLLPIRYGRMRQSPFAFLRGAAALMAADLAPTPATGIRVQACGDCHVANFGGFATPERRFVFDINDFDETFRAPWEWDVKRLASSVVLAMRHSGIPERFCANAARESVASYREHMREFAEMTAVDVWYSHLDTHILAENAKGSASKKHWRQIITKASGQTSQSEFPKLVAVKNNYPHIVDHRPLLYHPREAAMIGKHVRQLFARYKETLPKERRILLDRYEIVDVARKVVGVGAVGTRCAVALLMAGPQDPLLLQFKEARPSVLEKYAGGTTYRNQGERVVVGQRMLQ